MSTLTPNLSLTKPAGSDAADVAVLNANMDILDNVATLVGSQTLTNKTLISPHLTTPVVDSGGLTITSGALTLGATASQIVPGATSLSLRNNANNADNLLITDAGVVTVRAGLTCASLITTGTNTIGGQTNLTGSTLGFFNHSANTQPTVVGSRSANAALASLLTGLASLGLVVDSSS